MQGPSRLASWLLHRGSGWRGPSTHPTPLPPVWVQLSWVPRCQGTLEEHGSRAPASLGTQGRLPVGGDIESDSRNVGVGVAWWNRIWGKSIQERGSACAKARKRESGAFGHRKTVFGVVEMQSGQQGPEGWVEMGLFGCRRGGENAQSQQWWTYPAPVHRAAGLPHPGKKPSREGQISSRR